MIELSTEAACVLYLGMAIVTVLAIWLGSHQTSKKKKNIEFTLKHRTCEFCHFTYLEKSAVELSRCPQCQLLSEPSHKNG